MPTSKIEWVQNQNGTQGYTLNPVKGLCPVDCKDNQGKSYCYARRMYKRFKWNPQIRFALETLSRESILKIPDGSKVFIGSTMELFGDWIENNWMHDILDTVVSYPQHTFIFLTKKPENLIKWKFPPNCWVGVSVCNDKMLDCAVDKLEDVQAKKWISFEPLRERISLSLDYAFYYSGISWVVIGQQTPVSAKTAPKIEWIKEIVEAGTKAGCKIFMKDNLRLLLKNEYGWTPAWAISARDFKGNEYLRQEYPKERL